MLKQLLSVLTVYCLGFLAQRKKMENYYQRKKQMKKASNTGENSTYHSYENLVSSNQEDCQKNPNLHRPEWAKTLMELYTSPLKYKIRYELNDSK